MENPVSAVERMRESMNKAKSYKMKLFTEMDLAVRVGDPPMIGTSSGEWCWLASGSMRMEGREDGRIAPLSLSGIYFTDKPGIELNHTAKTFQRVPPRSGVRSPITLFQGLGKYSGDADKMLGTKTINGKEVLGFVIEAKKIDPDSGPGTVEVWIDTQSSLPAEVRIEMKDSQVPTTLQMVDFQWNVELDAKLFDPTPPKGYTDATPEPPKLEEQVRKISEGLKLYSETSGGHYPRVKIVYGDVLRDEMLRMGGFLGRLTDNQIGDDRYARIMQATRGLGMLSMIIRNNPDAAYFGRTIGPQDKDKVLLRWKLDNGRYQVMYGDLREETVTAERLRTLERR
jgi:hypothetical protein